MTSYKEKKYTPFYNPINDVFTNSEFNKIKFWTNPKESIDFKINKFFNELKEWDYSFFAYHETIVNMIKNKKDFNEFLNLLKIVKRIQKDITEWINELENHEFNNFIHLKLEYENLISSEDFSNKSH